MPFPSVSKLKVEPLEHDNGKGVRIRMDIANPRRRWKAAILSVVFLALAAAAISVGKSPPDKKPSNTQANPYWQENECVACHESAVTALANTRHGRAMEFGGWGKVTCQSCHGDTAEHAASADPAQVKNPSKLRLPEVTRNCMSCHAGGGHQQLWYGSAHDTSNVSCLDCHSVHHPKSNEKLLVKRTDAELCLSCHADVRKAQFQRSTHLFRNEWGDMRVSCVSCHAPHGSPTENLLRAASTNETCYTCHQEKRGPVLWEHPPVKENCMTCHTPHGSNNPGLLTHRTTQLCQQCHLQGRHQTVAGRPNSAWVINRGCLNCHPQIHGSNHPSGVIFQR